MADRAVLSVYHSPMNLTWERLPFRSLDDLRSVQQCEREIHIPIMDPRSKTPLDACLGPIAEIVVDDGHGAGHVVLFKYGYPTDCRTPNKHVSVRGVFGMTEVGRPKYTLFFG